ncbi:hypothetical protein F0562_014963 [Nyssa sinensis]|uniref:RAVE complex protein Rav1 C-terminal domain-containing protein n=1 Tax=Nyssa sinensis TaxID=561372 RepID=A0A5J4ZQ05_9ASTE|nr:hypothetical protein F0562_014963 [Nyssa sinensis]
MQERSTGTTTTADPPTRTIESENSVTTVDFADHLPLQIVKSETIPPAPTRSESTIDWLPDFAGYSWIAYGASSLLVICHLPSPISQEEALIGPIFRQVIELSTDGSAAVSAVSWSAATPSVGDLAAALDNCIGLFSHNSYISDGSFCWSQTAVLVQSSKVEALKWTGSGDGIISGGIEVVLWRKKDKSWEIAWKFRTELPQTLVSATCFIEGPSATAPLSKLHVEGSSSLINEWRPLTGRQAKKGARYSLRHVLLTCCLDGTIRLWTEIDGGRIRRIGKDINDQRTVRRSFRVAAVIEINQALNGTLGTDIYVRWAMEAEGIVSAGKGASQYFSSEGYHHYKAGRCEWLIGFGPQMLVTFWAIHCLDDVTPVRFPRVTLWKKQELLDPIMGPSSLLLSKVVILRNQVFGPPTKCSLIWLLPCNSLGRSELHTQISANIEDGSLDESRPVNLLSCCAGGVLNMDSHTGKILQVAVHPFKCEIELAVSLDSDGLLLFWSLSTNSNSIMGLPTLFPTWKLSGKLVVRDPYPKYTSLSWAPSVLDDDRVLLMGHLGGIDCFIVKISRSEEEKVLCHNLCTIPFSDCLHGDGSMSVCSIPLSSSFLTQEILLKTVDGHLKGILAAHQGPITVISLTDCGRKIATTCPAGYSNTSSTLCIWESVQLAGAGSFILEDTLFLDGDVIALNWLTMGNGQLLLGVCLQNELQVYAQRRCGGQTLVNPGKSLEANIWLCIAFVRTDPAIRDFLWGPRATAVVVHDEYFCLFSQWLFFANKKHQAKCDPKFSKDNPIDFKVGSDKEMLTVIFTDCDIGNFKPSSKEDNVSIGFWSVLDVVEKLCGSLPVYHPEALLMNICSGYWKRAYVALQHVVEHLTNKSASMEGYCSAKSSHVIPPIRVSNYLEGLMSTSSSDKAFQWSEDTSLITSSSQQLKGLTQFAYSWRSDASDNILPSSSTKSELSGFVEPVEKLYEFAAITNVEKMQILAIIDLLHEVSNPHSASAYESLDEPGRRFWVAIRFQQLFFVQRCGRLPSMGELVVDSGLIGWAFHSDCQENLFNSLLPNEPSWQDMRNMGVGFWYTNVTHLRLKMEKLARQQYLKNKDPKACALLYIALNRLQVLASLFKISKDDKDKPLVGFLLRNFQEEKNKAAALKNAYVLMGRHQLELAIAFFLLGGDTSSAVTVCAKNLGDEQLALVICRLVEGYGGPLERHLISKSLLPSAIGKGDYWLTSFLEGVLGNYLQSFLSMLGAQMDSLINKSALLSNHASFLDPSIGQYCLMLATKNSMKNAVGEQKAAILSRWAILMSATAWSRCGLPLEALECLSSSLSILGGPDQGSELDMANAELLNEMLEASPNSSSSNWISADVAFQMESHAKLDLAMQYISKLLKEHPSWLDMNMASTGAFPCSEYEIHQYKILLENFQHELTREIAFFDQKFSLMPLHLINMIVIFLCNRGLMFIGYHILHCYSSQDPSQDTSNAFDSLLLYAIPPKLLLKATEEMSCLFSRYVVACSITCSQLKSCNVAGEIRYGRLAAWRFYMQGLIWSLRSIRSALKLFSGSCAEDLVRRSSIILDLSEYYVTTPVQHEQGEDLMSAIPEDERWQIIGALLWEHMSGFLKHQLNSLSEKLEDSYSFGPLYRISSMICNSVSSELDDTNLQRSIRLVSAILAKSLNTTCAHISSYRGKLLTSFLQHKVQDGLNAPCLLWLEELSQSQSRATNKHLTQSIVSPDIVNNENELSAFKILLDICADPKIICGSFSLENLKWSEYIKQKPSRGWHDMYVSTTGECEAEETCNQEVRLGITFARGTKSAVGSLSSDGHSFLSFGRKDTTLTEEAMSFQHPKEIYKRNGELLEALCINSIDQQEAALASNRKGIIFFNWEDELHVRDQSHYIWAEADWPQNGLDGATVGVGNLARPRRDLTGGGAFGIPGYAGIGTSSLGWGIQEDFEEFVDPPATLENTSARAFSSHPSRPFFLVGSSSAHIYLWEFGKDKATATYGLLPAANVPPPYALASISGAQFNHCGHRFATSALDGTVCAWQLEVGGRSNICPTESSVCFNDHASDVTYVTSSGSIIAAAGYSSNGINVVIWDTIAPPTTSRASIMCHEGGARSISVFDNDIGSGSISPLIVTGGKGGDVGLHDFRYIATGRTKRHRHSDSGEQNISASPMADMHNKIGDQNSNGMLWYIPKAHLGSVTKISTIPNTSFFLTGSKDGDVKLWDAKRAKLVCHWSKLHERHTFLQPSSRGFGGVVRAAVTDIQVFSHGFLTCGGDGSVKLVQLNDFPSGKTLNCKGSFYIARFAFLAGYKLVDDQLKPPASESGL